MIIAQKYSKKDKKFIKYFILAILLAVQSTDLLHDHHDHHHDEESQYCVACHVSNIDHDLTLQSYNFFIGFSVGILFILIVTFIRKEKLIPQHLPRSPPFSLES